MQPRHKFAARPKARVFGSVAPPSASGSQANVPSGGASSDAATPQPRRARPSRAPRLSAAITRVTLGLLCLLLFTDPHGVDGAKARVKVVRAPFKENSHLDPDYLGRCKDSVTAFNGWLEESAGIDLDTISGSGLLLAYSLKSFGIFVHDCGLPRYIYTHAITGVQHKFREHATCLGPAWAVDRQWAQQEPSENRVVMPKALVRAVFSVAVPWGWVDWAAEFLSSVSGMLRPIEIRGSFRKSLALPRDRLEKDGDAFLKIPDPKGRRFWRRQHARFSEQRIVKYLDAVWGTLPPDEPLSVYSAYQYRIRWDAILSFLDVPHKGSNGVTPASTRGTGATIFYIDTEDLSRTMWRGRWARQGSAEAYLQEAAGSRVLAQLEPAQRQLVTTLATAADSLIEHLCLVGVDHWRRVIAASPPATSTRRSERVVSRKLCQLSGTVLRRIGTSGLVSVA